MRRLFFGSLSVLLVLSSAVFANETAQSNEELLRRLAALENSNARLEEENASLRSQVRHRENGKKIAESNGHSLPVSSVAPPSHTAIGAYASAPIVAFNWTGFYVGSQAGYGWNTNSYTYTGAFPGISIFKTSGFVGGGEIGYNWQTGPMVFGLEGDISYANLNSSGVVTVLRPCVAGAPGCSANLNWFGTGRARLGYAGGALLTFVTGGAAVGRVQGSADTAACGIGVPTCEFDETRWGWTAGAGVEWNFNTAWSAKVEYLYINLGTPSFTATPVTTSDLAYNVVRAGVNLHF